MIATKPTDCNSTPFTPSRQRSLSLLSPIHVSQLRAYGVEPGTELGIDDNLATPQDCEPAEVVFSARKENSRLVTGAELRAVVERIAMLEDVVVNLVRRGTTA